MASRIIRRSRSDPRTSRRKVQVALVEGKLFIKRGTESNDETSVSEDKPSQEKAGFRHYIKRSRKGHRRGLRVTSAYVIDDHRRSFPTIHECEIEGDETEKRLEEKKVKLDPDRRHTLGVIGDWEEYNSVSHESTEEPEWVAKNKKNEVLFEYLKKRYPEYSHIIDKKMASDTIIIPFTNGYAETDLDDTMSEADTSATGGFRRGGRARSSLPIVRHATNKSKEKSLGLIYLMYKGETKRALMPNEITGKDTVRALFVRSFPGKLTMQVLELPERKIYIRDPLTEIFYELENVNEIRDRSVLKVYDAGPGGDVTGEGNARSSSSTPVESSYHSEPEVDQARAQIKQGRYNTMAVPRITTTNAEVVAAATETRQRTNSEGDVSKQDEGFLQSRQTAPRAVGAPPQKSQPPPQQHQEQYFRRGTPQRATVGGTVPQRIPQNPNFQRRIPQRSSATMPRNVPQQRSAKNVQYQQRGGHPNEKGGPNPGQMSKKGQDNFDGRRGPQSQRPIQSGSKTLPPGAALKQPAPQNIEPKQKQEDMSRGATSPRKMGPEPDPRNPHYGTTRRTQNQNRNVPQGMSFKGQRSHPDLRTLSNAASAIPNGSMMSDDENARKIEAMEKQIANLAGMVRTALINGKGQPQQDIQRSQSVQLYSSKPRAHQTKASHPAQGTHIQQGTHPPHGLHQPQRVHQPQGTHQPQSPQRKHPPHQELQKKLIDIKPAEVEFIKPTGEPTTPNIGFIDTKSDGRAEVTITKTTKKQQVMSPQTRRALMTVKGHLRDLKEQHRNIRQMHMNMLHQMNNNFKNTSMKIKQVLDRKSFDMKPSGFEHPIRVKRRNIQQRIMGYKQSKLRINKDLNELEGKVDALRVQTLNNKKQVNQVEVDYLAKALNNNSRLIADQKALFPEIADELKSVMEGEMEVVVHEESFLRDEPGELDDYYRRCKNLTGTLYTLKRLAEVQDMQNVKELQKPISVDVKSSKPSNNSSNQTVTQPKLRKRFSSAAEKLRFEKALQDGKRRLRTTLFAQNATMRRRKILLDLYNKDTHDHLTPMITAEKAARKEAQKKKGPPPPPPPRRGASVNKTNTLVSSMPTSIQITETRIIDTVPLGANSSFSKVPNVPMCVGSVPDIANLGETHPTLCSSQSSDNLSHHMSMSSSQSPSCTHYSLSKSCESNLHACVQPSDMNQSGYPGVLCKTGTKLANQKPSKILKDSQNGVHRCSSLRSGVSEPDIIASSQKAPPKPPRGFVTNNSERIVTTLCQESGKSAFRIVSPRSLHAQRNDQAIHSRLVRNGANVNAKGSFTLPQNSRGRPHMCSRKDCTARNDFQNSLRRAHSDQAKQMGNLRACSNSTPLLSTPISNPSQNSQQPSQFMNHHHPGNKDKSQKHDQRVAQSDHNQALFDERTRRLKEQYARLRQLQQEKQKKKENQVKMSQSADGLDAANSPYVILAKDAVSKEAIINQRKNLTMASQKSSRRDDEINQAFDELESLVLKAGDTADVDDEKQNGISHSVPALKHDECTTVITNGTIYPPVHAQLMASQSPPRSYATRAKPPLIIDLKQGAKPTQNRKKIKPPVPVRKTASPSFRNCDNISLSSSSSLSTISPSVSPNTVPEAVTPVSPPGVLPPPNGYVDGPESSDDKVEQVVPVLLENDIELVDLNEEKTEADIALMEKETAPVYFEVIETSPVREIEETFIN